MTAWTEDPKVRRLAPFAAVAVTGLLALVVPARGADSGGAELAGGLPVAADADAGDGGDAGATDIAEVPAPGSDGPAESAAPPELDTSDTFTGAAPLTPANRSGGSAPSPSGSSSDGPSASPSDFALPPRPTPLRVTVATWASATPGSPLDGSIPEGALPVGAAAGEDHKRSFIRVEGTETTLTLEVVDEEGATYLAEQGSIAVCEITQGGWDLEPGSSFEDAPEYDAAGCVEGAVSDDGMTVAFELGAFGDDPGAGDGFALVPGEPPPDGAAPTPLPVGQASAWQITLRPA